MPTLTRNDYSTVLALLARLEPMARERGDFLRAVVRVLADVVSCEQACVSVGPAAANVPGAAAGQFLVALELGVGGKGPVRVELRRRQRDFNSRERERLALLQPHLAFLYGQAASHPNAAPTAVGWPVRSACAGLTPREVDVMRWVACGKTDADVGVLLAISTRTVHKHLEHIYEKLGVETRTAAVMAMGRRAGTSPSQPLRSAVPSFGA